MPRQSFGTKVGRLLGKGAYGHIYAIEDLIYDKETGKKYVLKTVNPFEEASLLRGDVDYYTNYLKGLQEKQKKAQTGPRAAAVASGLRSEIAQITKMLESSKSLLEEVLRPSTSTVPRGLMFNEIMAQKKAGELGIAPKVLTWSRDGNSFIMEYIDGYHPDFRQYSRAENKLVLDNVEEMIQRLHENGIYHNDLHVGNIILDNKTNRVYILDYGKATTSPVYVSGRSSPAREPARESGKGPVEEDMDLIRMFKKMFT
jgi:predicted Ser/Thr protein kinase